MTVTVLLILAVLWAAVLVPPALRHRSENRRGEPIGPLNFRLGAKRNAPPSLSSSLGSAFNRPTSGAAFRPAAFPTRQVGSARGRATVPGQMSPAQKRRRDVLVILVGAAGLSLAVALFTGMIAMWFAHGFVDLLLVTYLFLLVQLKQRSGAVATRSALPPPIPIERPRQARHAPHRELALGRTATP
ncbi:MAG: hypothetical protein ACRDY4_07610 [Acidimicrobiia bacterium]